MTKNEIKELTDIIMKADVYSVFKGGRIDKSKKYSYQEDQGADASRSS
jgi:hypothetical protein|nr:MAG TPA: hypothetical protein [Caudoviricetes sp.]